MHLYLSLPTKLKGKSVTPFILLDHGGHEQFFSNLMAAYFEHRRLLNSGQNRDEQLYPVISIKMFLQQTILYFYDITRLIYYVSNTYIILYMLLWL